MLLLELLLWKVAAYLLFYVHVYITYIDQIQLKEVT